MSRGGTSLPVFVDLDGTLVDSAPGIVASLTHAFAACGIEPPRGEDVFAATSLHTLVQMVSAGLGVSFLPEMAVRAGLADLPGVVVRPITATAPRREIVVAWRAGSSRAAEARLLADALRLD